MHHPRWWPSEIVLSWSFTTQSIGDVLTAARGLVGTPTTSVTRIHGRSFRYGCRQDADGRSGYFQGTIDLPYYLTASTGGVNDPTALGSFWKGAGGSFLTQFNPTPVATATATIPLLITTPVTGSAPWPVVIFQHGITSNRTAVLGIADAMAQAGFAMVAIDMPMHGVDSGSPFYQTGKERTFDLDLVTQDAQGNITAAVPDGVTDSSGRHFINLTNLLNTRDNVRQSVADLFALAAAIPLIDVDTGGADFIGSNARFVGHSLGAIVGTVFLALEPNVKAGVLAFGGGMLPKILDGSSVVRPEHRAGPGRQRVIKTTPDYESFPRRRADRGRFGRPGELFAERDRLCTVRGDRARPAVLRDRRGSFPHSSPA